MVFRGQFPRFGIEVGEGPVHGGDISCLNLLRVMPGSNLLKEYTNRHLTMFVKLEDVLDTKQLSLSFWVILHALEVPM